MGDGRLTAAEYAEYCELDDRACRGEHLSDDETQRRRELMRRRRPPPPAEVQQKQRENPAAQAIAAGFAAVNRGDTQVAEELLAAIATPPRSEIEQLERRINTALRRATKRPRSMPVRTGRVRHRAHPRRRIRRTVLTAPGPPGREASGDDDPPSSDLAPSRLRLLVAPARCWVDARLWRSLVWRRLRRELREKRRAA